MSKKQWPYPEGKPRWKDSGAFTAWLVGTWYPRSRLSAAAWRLQPVGNTAAILDAEPSQKADSDAWRATAGGVATIFEALPDGSSVEIRCSNEPAMVLLQKLVSSDWDPRALVTSSGDDVAAVEPWNRILAVGRDRRLTVVAVYEPSDSPRSKAIFEKLKALAKKTQS